MVVVYLALNAAFWGAVAAAATLAPARTSAALRLRYEGTTGLSEYVTAYGGIALGLGLFFLLAALTGPVRTPGLLFALLLWGSITAFRLGSLVALRGVGRLPRALLLLEALMAAAALLLLVRG